MAGHFTDYPIIFTHVPRSAGTTLVSIMKRHFPKREQFFFYVREKFGNTDEALQEYYGLDEQKKKRLKLLQGHTSFGIHESHDKHTYVTLLRDPVERIVSYYYYILKEKGHYLHNVVMGNGMKLGDFVSSGMSAELDNIQTRQLSGMKLDGFDKCTPEMLKIAKENLIGHYKVFGITERFDETLMLMARYFDWPSPFYRKLNTIRVKPMKAQVSPSVRQQIERVNTHDMELYRFASDRFQQLIDGQKGDFKDQLGKFQQRNEWFDGNKNGRFGEVLLSLWKLYTKISSGAI